MANVTLKIEGMACGHCTASVKKTLEALGCTDVNVSLENASAQFNAPENFTAAQIAAEVNALGFAASEVNA